MQKPIYKCRFLYYNIYIINKQTKTNHSEEENKMMKLVNNNKGIYFEGDIYMYNTYGEAKKVMDNIEAVSKFVEVNVHKVLFDTCKEITDIMF